MPEISRALTPARQRRQPSLVRRVELALLHNGLAGAAEITAIGRDRIGVRLAAGLSDAERSRALDLIDKAMGGNDD